jgi:lipopolysaccharide export system permease protein
MFKKVDKLVLKSFFGPFILTTSVVVFIFLIRFLLMYFAEFIGKDLGYDVFAKLFGFFTLITIPTAMPLAILLSSIISFGNLGEFSELTAIKGAGIPISRVFRPAFIFAIIVSIFTFWFTTTVSPWANLKGYSMLWDVKTTKLTLNVEEGIFYTGIPGYSIKVNQKVNGGKTLKDITIYDHRSGSGNNEITLADSGKMYTINNAGYLVFELYNGYNYRVIKNNNSQNISQQQFLKNGFAHNKLVMSLESFGLKRTDEESFKYHPYMKNLSELGVQIDSLKIDVKKTQKFYTQGSGNLYSYHFKSMVDSVKIVKPGDWIYKHVKKFPFDSIKTDVYAISLTDAKSVLGYVETNITTMKSKHHDEYMNEVEWQHKFTQSFSVLILFLIGASLGSIIKKGGFGLPVLIAICIFILMYVLTQFFDKLAKEGELKVIFATWIPNAILLAMGLWFLSKSFNDSQFVNIDFAKLKEFFKKKKVSE